MFLTFLLFFVGFYILIKGANILVDGASSFAHKFKISGLVIGLVIVGIGTSIPEFSISFLANILDKHEITLGTVIGSNTLNILFILGVSAILFPLKMKERWVKRDFVWNIFAVGITALFALSSFMGENFLGISRLEGLVMLAIFISWLYYSIKHSNNTEEEMAPLRLLTIPAALLMIFAGLAGVVLGGKWVVDGGILIARELGASEALIGLTIIGIGTSLPELTVSVTAAHRKQMGIAVGNIIGSNIFDFLMILGFSALVKPVVFPRIFLIDITITIFSAIILLASMFIGEKYTLSRSKGFVFILFYISYLVYLL